MKPLFRLKHKQNGFTTGLTTYPVIDYNFECDHNNAHLFCRREEWVKWLKFDNSFHQFLLVDENNNEYELTEECLLFLELSEL